MATEGKTWLDRIAQIEITPEEFNKIEKNGVIKITVKGTNKYKHLYSKEFIDEYESVCD